MLHVDLEAIVSPGTEFKHAVLLIEGEVFDIDFAVAFKYGGRAPFDSSGKRYGSLGH